MVSQESAHPDELFLSTLEDIDASNNTNTIEDIETELDQITGFITGSSQEVDDCVEGLFVKSINESSSYDKIYDERKQLNSVKKVDDNLKNDDDVLFNTLLTNLMITTTDVLREPIEALLNVFKPWLVEQRNQTCHSPELPLWEEQCGLYEQILNLCNTRKIEGLDREDDSTTEKLEKLIEKLRKSEQPPLEVMERFFALANKEEEEEEPLADEHIKESLQSSQNGIRQCLNDCTGKDGNDETNNGRTVDDLLGLVNQLKDVTRDLKTAFDTFSFDDDDDNNNKTDIPSSLLSDNLIDNLLTFLKQQ